MDSKTFDSFREIVYHRSGIRLREGKEALVSARVGKRMRELGIASHQEYLALVKADEDGSEIVHLLDHISTNVTSFFREAEHFDLLYELVTKWLDKGQRRFRFWSAACSSGEEPYTMAMILLKALEGVQGVDARILATDLSTRILERCKQGTYREDKVDPVPQEMRDKYFEKHAEGEKAWFTVRPSLREPILFRWLNLSVTPFPMKGPMDIIFCRNVMIYFDNEVRRQLLKEMYRLLKPGGYLLVGHAESLTGMVSDFKVVRPSIYTK